MKSADELKPNYGPVYAAANSLRFEKLIRDLDNFQDILSMARIESRQPKPTPRTQILAATGRPTRPQTTAQPASVVLERTKLAQMLKTWKENGLP